MAETLNGITEINQRKILNLSSLPALNITPFAPLNNANIKRNYDEQKFLYDLNQIFISQFNIQGISENTTCSIIYHIKKYINSHNKKPDDIFNQYCDNKYKHYFTSIIGFFYEYGIGTVVNYYMAYDMYNQAVKDIYLTVTTNKHENSLLTDNLLKENQCIGLISLGLLYIYGKGIEVNQQKAFKLFLKSVSKGFTLGMCYIGDCYNDGYCVIKNKLSSFNWYLEAAKKGNAKAQTIVGYCYQYGDGVNENDKLAFEWYTKSAEGGNSLGQVHLAEYYLNGIGTSLNKQKAFKYYKKSANQGSNLGQINLSYLSKRYRNSKK